VWNILKRGGLTCYIEKIKGNNPKMTIDFARVWKDQIITLRGVIVDVLEHSVAMVTEMPMQGIKFFKYHLKKKDEMYTFLKDNERIHEMEDEFLNLSSISLGGGLPSNHEVCNP